MDIVFDLHNVMHHLLWHQHECSKFLFVFVTPQMYDNVSSLRFAKGPNNEMLAQAMVSGEGEQMEFRNHVTADGRVEDWMTNVLNEMRKTNRLITKESIFSYCDKISRYKCKTEWK